MKYIFTVEAESESELSIYANALQRELAMTDFHNMLRTMWKHDDTVDEDTIERVWSLWHENMGSFLDSH